MVAIEEAVRGRIGLAQLEPSDGEPLRRLFYRLSPETLYRRFLSPIARPEQTRPDRLLDVDADAWQGQGLATRMLAALAGQACAVGIERFTLITHADNRRMLRLLRRVHPSVRFTLSAGAYETTVPVGAFAARARS